MRVSSNFFSSIFSQEQGAGRGGHPSSYSFGCVSGAGLNRQIRIQVYIHTHILYTPLTYIR